MYGFTVLLSLSSFATCLAGTLQARVTPAYAPVDVNVTSDNLIPTPADGEWTFFAFNAPNCAGTRSTFSGSSSSGCLEYGFALESFQFSATGGFVLTNFQDSGCTSTILGEFGDSGLSCLSITPGGTIPATSSSVS